MKFIYRGGRILAAALVWIGMVSGPLHAQSGSILVAAASSMKFAFDELVPAFQETHPDTPVKISFGSSGNFFSQIRNGAPFDIFFSADMEYPRQLMTEGLATPETSVIPYALGGVVLWMPDHVGVDVRREKINALLNPAVRKIAIANPRHAPYGRTAVEIMKRVGIYHRLQPRLVLGENITHAAQFLHTGAAQAGIIALSVALTDKMQSAGTYWEIPEKYYRPIEQGALVLKHMPNAAGAQLFLDFVRGRQGDEILQRYGFRRPAEPAP